MQESCSPMENKFINYVLGDYFQLDKLFENPRGSEVLYRYALVLPVGKFRFSLDYVLLSGNQGLVVHHEFQVVPVPATEPEAFNSYKLALEDACISHPVYGNNTYSASSPSFIEKYPSSRYSQHAAHLAEN